ncbi:MAG: hypothetical protein HGA35_05300 [Erysipelotrichaceae bacterium]|nr:hypothetical protein [Erysipelotrichaceae bacterium]
MMNNIYIFLEEYTLFFEEMVEAEKLKLSILLSNDLKAIEENILVQQVNAKRIENMERKRLELFNSLGYNQLTFKEIIQLNQDESNLLTDYYSRVEKAINQIKHFNKKSLELIRFNLSLSDKETSNDDMKGNR